MISHSHKCIFIHIPKCAGTSFESALGHFDLYNGRGRQDHRSIRMIEKPFNLSKAIMNKENIKDSVRRFREQFRQSDNPYNKLQVTRTQFQGYYKFTVVRNPWDRAFSWYKNVMRDSIHQSNYKIPSNLSFYDFIVQFAGCGYLRPQTYWLENYDNNVELDYIGKFEDLRSVFEEISNKLSIPISSFPKETHGSDTDKSSTDIMTQDSIDFIADFYQHEIEMFNYSQRDIVNR